MSNEQGHMQWQGSLDSYMYNNLNGYNQSLGRGRKDSFKLPKDMFSTGYRKDESQIGLMEYAKDNGTSGLEETVINVVGMDYIESRAMELKYALEIDKDMLIRLGFRNNEIGMLIVARFFGCSSSVQKMVNKFKMDFRDAQRVKYMDDIMTGRVTVNNRVELAEHLKRIYTGARRLDISDLAISTVTDMPRKVAVFGIKADRFKLFNSNAKGYKSKDRIYTVTKISQSYVHFITKKRPVIKYDESLEETGVCKVVRIIDECSIEVAVHKNHCMICNRFIILASMKKPSVHFGMVEIICRDGSTVYVYAQASNAYKQSNYYSGNQRVYDYGYFGNEIRGKLLRNAQAVYARVNGLIVTVVEPTMKFETLSLESNGVSTDSDSSIEDDINFDKV